MNDNDKRSGVVDNDGRPEYTEETKQLCPDGPHSGPQVSTVQAWNNKVFIKGNPEIGAYVWKKWKQRDVNIGYSYVRLGELVQVWRFERRGKSSIITITHVYNVKGWVLERYRPELEANVINIDAANTARRLDYGKVQD